MKKMKIKILIVAAALTTTSLIAHAGALSVTETTTLMAPPAKVWTTIGNFGSLGWHPAVAKTEITKGTAGHAGAVRKITLQDGALIIEEQLSQQDHALTYRIVDSPLPVTGYESELKVEANGDHTKVIWSSTFDAKEGVKDEDAKGAIVGVYNGGFEALKKQFGGSAQ
jgi:hypothetical protein